MNKRILIAAGLLASLASLGAAMSAHDKYSVKVPGGLGFSEFRGYETWSVVSLSDNNGRFAAILGNPVLIDAYKAGIPSNGKPFPDGSKIAKLHYVPQTKQSEPGGPRVPGAQVNADFMIKDSKRFADTGGWGYASFDYDSASDTFAPATESSTPPQAHDAKCGAACHTIVKSRDFVFTDYAHR
jgi:hypothetical protein